MQYEVALPKTSSNMCKTIIDIGLLCNDAVQARSPHKEKFRQYHMLKIDIKRSAEVIFLQLRAFNESRPEPAVFAGDFI